MAHVCEFCGKKTRFGNTVAIRGLPKWKGGVGLKVTGIRPRSFKPNLQRVRHIHNGRIRRILVCTGCLKRGLVSKPPVRRPAAAATR